MGVANGGRQRIRRIGSQIPSQAQQAPNHVLYLILISAAGADHGQLDRPGRVFGHRQAAARAGTNGSASRMSEFQCRTRIAMDENLLDRGDCRFVLSHDFRYLLEQDKQPLGKRTIRNPDDATREIA